MTDIQFYYKRLQQVKAFSGYLAGNGSRPKGKMDDANVKELLTGVRDEQSFGAKMSSDTVCIHLEDKKSCQYFLTIIAKEKMQALIINFDNVKNQGYYIFFRKPASTVHFTYGNHISAIGLPMKVLTGNYYIPLKINGTEAHILVPETMDDIPRSLDTVPPAFYETDLQHQFCGLDGTNESTFESLDDYKTVLFKTKKLTGEACKSILYTINQHLLKAPLPDDDYKKLTDFSNADPNGTEFVVNGKFKHDECARYMAEKYHAHIIMSTKTDSGMYLYNGSVYRMNYDDVIEKIHAVYPDGTDRQRIEVYKAMKLYATKVKMADPSIIACNNGLIDLKQPENEQKLMPFTPDVYVTHQVACNYLETPYEDTEEYKFLNSVLDSLSCGDEGVKKMLIAMAAYCMYFGNPLRYFFVMVGEPRSGKSTMLSLIESVIGDEECESLDIEDLFARFGPANLCGKLVNLSDELPDRTLTADEVKTLKKITGAKTAIKGELKGKDYFSFVPIAKLIFSCNGIPRMHDADGGCLNRLVPIPMNARYDENNKDTDPHMDEKLKNQKVIDIFGTMCIKALNEMKITTKEARFPICESAKKAKEVYSRDSDSLRAYINSCGIEASDLYGKTVHEVYIEYSKYSREAGINGYSERTFQRQLFKMFPICTIQKRVGTERRRLIVPTSSITPNDTGVQY